MNPRTAELTRSPARTTETKGFNDRLSQWLDESAGNFLLLPAIILVLLLSIFPLLASLFMTVTRLTPIRGGWDVKYVGTANFEKLLLGAQQRHFLGKFGEQSQLGWVILAACAGVMVFMYARYLSGPRRKPFGAIMRLIGVVFGTGLLYATLSFGELPQPGSVILMACVDAMVFMYGRYLTSPRRKLFGAIMRLVAVVFGTGLLYATISTLSEGGIPGTVVVTLIFVFVGVACQYLIGLGLALLVTQNLRGKRFFRVVFLLPMMITPVGIGFLFRMLADTGIGPLSPIWVALGLKNFSWADNAASARMAVLIGDIWQWTPFMFIILLAALEATSQEQVEAALVDGATRFRLFRYILLPQIMPVSTTLVLIRLIEAFKMIEMPKILTGGGPGTATETMTLYAANLWGTFDLGTSTALAYMLLAIVTYVAVVYVNSIRRRLVENL
jgi:multiple sugar transport system permease protein